MLKLAIVNLSLWTAAYAWVRFRDGVMRKIFP